MNQNLIDEVTDLGWKLIKKIKSYNVEFEKFSHFPELHPEYSSSPEEYNEARKLLMRMIEKIRSINEKMLSQQAILSQILYKTVLVVAHQDLNKKDSKVIIKQKITELVNYESYRYVDLPIISLEVIEPFKFGPVTFLGFSVEDKRSDWGTRVTNYLNSTYSALSIARVESPGDQITAMDHAFNVIEKGLLLLKGIGFPLVAASINQIEIINKYSLWQNAIFRIHRPDENNPIDNYSGVSTRIGPILAKYDLYKDIIGSISRERMDKIIEIVERGNGFYPSSKMEAKLLRGLSWIGEATRDDALDARYAKLAFALESLIGGEANEDQLSTRGITATLASRAAFLISDDKEKRLEVDKKIREYYSKRSDIVHGGSAIISENEFENFGSITRNIAWGLLDRLEQFNDVDDLQKWVKEMSYS